MDEADRDHEPTVDLSASPSVASPSVVSAVDAETNAGPIEAFEQFGMLDASLVDSVRSGSLWRTVFERSPVPLSLVSTTGRQLAGNAAYLRFLGYGPDELEMLHVEQTTQDVDRAWTQAYLRRLVSGDLDRYTTEKTFVRKDGTTARGRLEVSPIVHDGRCVALLGAITPVVERVPMGDGMLRKLIENIHDTISLVDGEGRLVETTGRYKPIMGYPREFWETRSIFDLLVPEHFARVMELQEQVLARPGETVTAELSVMSAQHTVENLEVHAVNMLDDPDIAGIVITSRNVTSQHAMVEELKASRDDALAEAELRSRVLATVSHELRNPLHAVQGISELLASSDLPEAERALAGTINRQVRDLTRVVDDLLTSSRLELDSVSLEMDSVDLRELLSDIVSIARTAAAPGVEVNALIDMSIPPLIRTDPVRLRQVLSNLVGNAVKFTTSGRVRVLAGLEGNDWLELEVSDTGAGIPPDELATIFEPFRSASTAGRRAGAGLGLSIVRRIIGMLDGTVAVSSTEGSGSTFTIRLPLQIASAPAGAAAPATTNSTVSTTAGSTPGSSASSTESATVGRTATDAAPLDEALPGTVFAEPVAGPPVLVIEDNAVNQQLARAQLKSMGYDCHIAGSGEDGLAYLASPAGVDVEVVLMDYHLPGIDGLETTRRIRELEAASNGGSTGAHVAIVGVTASASLGDRTSCLQAGMDDYVAKPVSLADLAAAFERVNAVRLAVRSARAAATSSGPISTEPSTPSTPSSAVAVSEPAPDEGAEPADVPVDPSVDVLDTEALVTLAEELGDRGTVVDLIDTFLIELPARIDGIVASGGADGDRDALHRLVHTLTSSARLLGAGTLAVVCRDYEAGRLGGSEVRTTAAQIRHELERWARP